MEIQQVQQVRKYVNIVFRRKMLIAFFTLVGAAAGLAFYLWQPKVYESSTLLSYQQQRVSPAKMSPDVQARISDIVSTLSQIITSRTSLERIIEDVNLYEEARRNLPMEDVIVMMRKNIDIMPSRKGDTFRIEFQGSQPDKVARVANTLAARFIEENLKFREERASDTFSYTRSELEMAKEVLDRKEAVMRDYKLKFFNEMPEQRANNVVRLNSLQEQYQNRQDSIQDLERTRVLVQDQITIRKQMVEENKKLRQAIAGTNSQERTAIESEEERLQRLQRTLESMLSRYTERHPEVRILKKQIADLEESVGVSLVANQDETDLVGTTGRFDRVLADLQIQLKDIKLNIEKLNREKEDLLALIGQYEEWVAKAPVRGAEWATLTREYGELKRHYDFLVSQNLQAQSALNLERKQKGSQFKIEDPARTPQQPISPDFRKIMAAALLIGSGLGIGLALGREILDSSFKDPAELEQSLNIDLICTVPYLPLKRERIKQIAITAVGTLFTMVCTVVLLVAFVYFYRAGRIVF